MKIPANHTSARSSKIPIMKKTILALALAAGLTSFAGTANTRTMVLSKMKSLTALAKLSVLVGLFVFAVGSVRAQGVLTMANSNNTPGEDFTYATYIGSLEWINLSGDNLSGANLSVADLSYANLDDANLTYAGLFGATLFDASLSHATLTGAYLFGAYLESAILTSALLDGAYLESATLISAVLNGANLTTADFNGADLTSADLTSADLTNADLTNADLTLAIFSGGNLFGANFLGANLTGVTGLETTYFGGTAPTYDSNTIFTGTNFNPVTAGWTLVPEPSTYALFGMGAIGILIALRRKKTA